MLCNLTVNLCKINLNGPSSNLYWRKKNKYVLGMHDIYRTDKLSTDMGENDFICIAPINKWKSDI